MANDPQIQLICNVITINSKSEVLLVRFDGDPRWWLPGRDLAPFEHPEEVAPGIMAEVEGVKTQDVKFMEIESFRGRRGWHVMFNYRATGKGAPPDPEKARWFPADNLPQTAHGDWERDRIRKALE